MIQIESITMKEVRGLRDLTLDFDNKSFVVSGPNGSGKSGVVDAIEFCLTGEISRLSGKGTAGITLQRHGPHVDRRDDPAAAEVTIHLRLLKLNKSAVITRNMKKPRELRIEPNDPDIRAALEEVASHPEVVLSRREIIKYVLAEAGERSKEVQALLRLDRISQIRGTLGTAYNKLKTTSDQAAGESANALTALQRHLDIETTSPENILATVNERRVTLGLEGIETLAAHTKVDAGVEAGATASAFNKDSALRDVDALKDSTEDSATLRQLEVDRLLDEIAAIEADPDLLKLVQRESFLETGLGFLDSQFCPLCDSEWTNIDALRSHLEEKLALSAAAGKRRKAILKDAGEIAKAARSVRALVVPVIALATGESKSDMATKLTTWTESLAAFADQTTSIEGVVQSKARLTEGWIEIPDELPTDLASLRTVLKAKPDQSATVNAQTYLTRAQDRYSEFREARQKQRAAAKARDAAKVALDTYSAVSEEKLSAMYESVEEDFSSFYREINSGDETAFKARLEQGAGKLDLSVDFYGLGMFPPGAYHSEGHQDGMGVCLYLALMKRLFGDNFSFAVLDDVVMSIDSGHRKQFCRLLREVFPKTQFIITTHDAIWARQMQSEKLVGPRASVEFQGWSVQTGPVFEPVSEVWDRIDADLKRNDVPAAAGRLRRHLEYTSTELADLLAARVAFRGDAGYELGDLFPPVVGRQGDLLKLASAAANSWNDTDAATKAQEMKDARSEALAYYGGEQWVVNKAVHFNEWASFSKADFAPVVEAVRALLEQWQCKNPECGSWLYPTPKQDPESLRCHCGSVNVNLKKK
jgi:recombinational DNA repair ATPase RecF